MRKLKLFELEKQQDVKIDVVKGEHRQNVLKILNEFKEYVNNPVARAMVLHVSGERNCFNINSGLCCNITSLFSGHGDYTIQLVKLFREWPNSSGSTQHPIRTKFLGDENYISERAEYIEAYNAGYGLYDKDSEYCLKRLDLLDFIINKIDSDFNNYVWVH